VPPGRTLRGLAIWALLTKLLKREAELKLCILWATVGYATHAVLDACTSYGTLLLWPLFPQRVAWDLIAVIDPIFTLALLVGVVASLRTRRPTGASLALLAAGLYLGANALQSSRVEKLIRGVARERDHAITRLAIHPTLFNNLVWRVLYLDQQDVIHAQAVHAGWFGDLALFEGGSAARMDRRRDYPQIPNGSVLARDLDLFDHFSARFVGSAEASPNHEYGDLRYSILPNGLAPLWGIRFDPSRPQAHAEVWFNRRYSNDDLKIFWNMLRGNPWADREAP